MNASGLVAAVDPLNAFSAPEAVVFGSPLLAWSALLGFDTVGVGAVGKVVGFVVGVVEGVVGLEEKGAVLLAGREKERPDEGRERGVVLFEDVVVCLFDALLGGTGLAVTVE